VNAIRQELARLNTSEEQTDIPMPNMQLRARAGMKRSRYRLPHSSILTAEQRMSLQPERLGKDPGHPFQAGAGYPFQKETKEMFG
jgi:hypothetical protein